MPPTCAVSSWWGCSWPASLAFFTAASAVIDPQDLAALTQVVHDLNVPSSVLWDPGSDPCSTNWSKATCDDTQTRVTGLGLNSLSLTGFVSPALGNLTRLAQIDLSNNLLQGSIPESIGLLPSLNFLSLGLNNLTGPIPDSIGQLAALGTLNLDNNFLSGGIPASIGNLTGLSTLHLYCNHLEGEIPSQLGALSQLTDFQLHSNNLTGQIPAALANLTKVIAVTLNNNQLSGPLDLTLLQAWGASITTLHLHRNLFSGNIPAMDRTSFPKLQKLNLGFNRLTGQLPTSLGSMASLSSLFVGHNFLEGPVPGSYTNLQNLQFLDLSHNELNGSLQGVTGIGVLLQGATPEFDLTFNNFSPSISDSQLVQGNNTLFNCLQLTTAPPSPIQESPPGSSVVLPPPSCLRYLPGDSKGFAINAGGSKPVTNNDQLEFSPDNDLLDNITTGTEVENSTGDWAVQLSGDAGGTFSAAVQVSKNHDNALLYQSMRWSSQYLAYIGRNMRNGIFRVKLHFAEINFNYPGYRVFDVVVQGKMINASLDVAAVAGPKTAYVIDLWNVSVDDGLLLIELIHVSPINRWIDPAFQVQGTGPMISALSAQPVGLQDAPPPAQVPPGGGTPGPSSPSGKGSSKTTLVIVLAVGGSFIAVGFTLIAFFCFFKVRKDLQGASMRTPADLSDIGPIFYTYDELFVASNGFSEENELGRGGFGSVYKGVLPDGSIVAIKQLTVETQQSREAFRKEIAIISSVQHRNLLAIKGCCLETELPLLVCEYMPNGSLDKLLHGRDSQSLDWRSRRNIAVGAACGLAYLHDESKYCIIHCDVKPANILVDKDFNARIADFGLVRLYDEDNTHITASRIQGTRGYLAPEYALLLQLSDKADVYAFGVVLLELLSGRRILDLDLPSEKVVLVNWAQQLGQEGPSALLQLVDPKLSLQLPEQKEVLNMAIIANWCTQPAPSLRPKMRTVWLMLNGAIDIPKLPASSG